MAETEYADKISVIVPAYNAAQYIEDCVGSIFHQNFINLEIIIIEDGSSDETPAVCDRLAARYDKVRLVHQKNAGAAAARNRGLAMASGDWVMFVDADDMLSLGALSHALDAAKRLDADLVFFNMQYEYRNGRIKQVIPLEGDERVFQLDGGQRAELEDMMLTERTQRRESFVNMTGPYCKLMKKERTDGCRFPQELDSGEDACFVFQVLRNCARVVYLSDIFYRRIVREESLSMKQDDDFWRRRSDYVNWVLDYFEPEAKEKEEALNYFRYQNEQLVIWHYFMRNSKLSYRQKRAAVSAYQRKVKGEPNYNKLEPDHKIYLFFIKYRAFGVLNLLNHVKNVVKCLKRI